MLQELPICVSDLLHVMILRLAERSTEGRNYHSWSNVPNHIEAPILKIGPVCFRDADSSAPCIHREGAAEWSDSGRSSRNGSSCGVRSSVSQLRETVSIQPPDIAGESCCSLCLLYRCDDKSQYRPTGGIHRPGCWTCTHVLDATGGQAQQWLPWDFSQLSDDPREMRQLSDDPREMRKRSSTLFSSIRVILVKLPAAMVHNTYGAKWVATRSQATPPFSILFWRHGLLKFPFLILPRFWLHWTVLLPVPLATVKTW